LNGTSKKVEFNMMYLILEDLTSMGSIRLELKLMWCNVIFDDLGKT